MIRDPHTLARSAALDRVAPLAVNLEGHIDGLPAPAGAGAVATLLRDAATAIGPDPRRALTLAESARDVAQDHNDFKALTEALHLLGRSRLRLGEPALALDTLVEAARIARDRGDKNTLAHILFDAGKAHRTLSAFRDAESSYREALAISRETGDRHAEAEALGGLASVHHRLGEHIKALELLLKKLEIRREIHDVQGEARCLVNLGYVYTSLSDHARALESLTQAYRLMNDDADPKMKAGCVTNIGLLHERIGELDKALDYYAEGLDISRTLGDRVTEAICQLNTGEVLSKIGRYDAALEHLDEALSLSRRIGFRHGEVNALIAVGRSQGRLGDYARGLAAQRTALRVAIDIGDLEDETSAHLALGSQYLDAADLASSIAELERALTLAAQTGLRQLAAEAHERLADAHEKNGDTRSALMHFREFHRLQREQRDEESDRRTRVLAVQFDVERTRREAEFYRERNEVVRTAWLEAEDRVRERTAELEAAQVEIATRLALAAEYRDDQTGEHTWRVGWVSALLARKLELPDEQVELVRLAARLHDVGKIGMPDAILLKPGRLAAGEFKAMESHTVIGARILSRGRSKLLRLAEEIAYTHHERWDGTGYPRGLKGEQIPLAGRIVAVADVLDALTHDRPYKRAWSLNEALAEIERQRGLHFDPRIVDAAQAALTLDVWQDLEASARSARHEQDIPTPVQTHNAVREFDAPAAPPSARNDPPAAGPQRRARVKVARRPRRP